MESIFRHGPGKVPQVQTAEPESDRLGAAPDMPDMSSVHHAERATVGSKPWLAIHEADLKLEIVPQALFVMSGKELKTFVSEIPDDANVCYIDVGEGQHPRVMALLAGVAIVGKK